MSECLLGEGVPRTQTVKRTLIQGALINGMCLFADGTRAAGRRAYERRTRRTQAPLLQPQLVAVVRFGSLCSSSHTTKTALSSLQLLHRFACFRRA